MIEDLKKLDSSLVLFLNQMNNPTLDFLFFWISHKWIWIPFYAFLAFKVYRSESKYFILILVLIAAAITLSDQISSSLIKETVMRLRPCHDPELSGKIHLVNNYCGGKYGFISSHASNVFALAAFLNCVLSPGNRVLLRVIFLWAIVVSISRVYLGAHYPGDIIGGALLGLIIGSLLGKLFYYIKVKLNQRIHQSEN